MISKKKSLSNVYYYTIYTHQKNVYYYIIKTGQLAYFYLRSAKSMLPGRNPFGHHPAHCPLLYDICKLQAVPQHQCLTLAYKHPWSLSIKATVFLTTYATSSSFLLVYRSMSVFLLWYFGFIIGLYILFSTFLK